MKRSPLRWLLILLAVLCLYGSASAQKVKVLGVAEQSAAVLTSGATSSTKAERTFPSSTVTVYYAGTVLPAPIFSDAGGTVKSNPFTTDSFAVYDFFIAPGTRFDLRVSGTGVSIPFTRAGYTAPGTLGQTAVACGGTNDSALLSAANSAGGTIYISNTITCASNAQTLSIALQIDNGGLLKPITGQIVTLTGPQNPDPWQKFTNATSGLGTISFSGNQSIAYYLPQWWGVVGDYNGSTGTNNSPMLQAMFNQVPDGARIVITNGQGATNSAGIGLASVVTLTNRKTLFIFGPTEGPQRNATQFVWLGTGGTMFNLNYSQDVTFKGLGFYVPSGKSVDKFINIDGYNAGVGISTHNTIDNCFFDASAQGNTGFVGVDISATASNNNENMRVFDSDFYCSSTTGASAKGTGIRNAAGGNPNAKHQLIRYNRISQCAIGIDQEGGSIDVVHYGGGSNGIGLKARNFTETLSIDHYESESDVVGIDVGAASGVGDVFLSNCRFSNSAQTNTGGFLKLDNHVTVQNSVFESVPPVGGTLIQTAGNGNFSLVSINNTFPTPTVTMAQAGYNFFSALTGTDSKQQLISIGDLNISDAPSKYFFQYGGRDPINGSVSNFYFGMPIEFQCQTLAQLTATPKVATYACISDSNTVTWGATIAGGSTNKVMAWFNGSNWTVVAK